MLGSSQEENRKEHEATLFEERVDVRKERSLEARMNVLYDIMHEDDVEACVVCLWLLDEGEVLTDKCALLMALGKESLRLVDAALADVYACHAAARLGERQQVATLAATYLQHTGFRRQCEVRL